MRRHVIPPLWPIRVCSHKPGRHHSSCLFCCPVVCPVVLVPGSPRRREPVCLSLHFFVRTPRTLLPERLSVSSHSYEVRSRPRRLSRRIPLPLLLLMLSMLSMLLIPSTPFPHHADLPTSMPYSLPPTSYTLLPTPRTSGDQISPDHFTNLTFLTFLASLPSPPSPPSPLHSARILRRIRAATDGRSRRPLFLPLPASHASTRTRTKI